MPTITVASLEALNATGVLKLTNKVAMFADSTASPVTAPFDGTGALQALPAGYVSAGLITTDGFVGNRNITTATVNSDQTVQPLRQDVTADSETVQIKFIDSANQVVQAIDNNLTLAAMSSLTPFFSAVRRSSGVQPQRRICLIGEDTTRNIIVVKYFGNATVSAIGNSTWARSTELMYDYTFAAYPDAGTTDADGLQSASQLWIGGSGWAAAVGADTPAPAWQANHAYALNDLVTISGDTLKATTAGTSGSTQPTPPAAVGGTVTDGTVTWTRTA